MNLEEAKNLLELYPPIIEIRVPERYAYSEQFKVRLGEMMKNNWGEGKYILLFMSIKEMPSVLNLNMPDLSEEKLKEIADAWMRHVPKGQLSYITPSAHDDKDFEIIEPSYVKIHTVLEDGEELFKEKMANISAFVHDLNRDEKDLVN